MYRSQLLLKQLGIHQWIPQQQPTALYQADELWRDQNVDSEARSAVALALAPHQPLLKETAVATSTLHALPLAALQQSDQISPVAKDADLEPEFIEVIKNQYPASISFNCHVLVHEHFIIVAKIEGEEQQRLFNQIQLACHAETFFMQWPLAIDTWDMNDHVLQGYLHGVFATHQDKALFSLGEPEFSLPNVLDKTLKKHASLQQLLESAEQKRALWHALYPYIYDAETNNA